MTHLQAIKHDSWRQTQQVCCVAMIVTLDDGPEEALSG